MARSLPERWVRGLGLSFYAGVLLGIAWGLPNAVGQLLTENQALPDWLQVVLGILWLIVTLLFGPLAFEWLARKTGLTMDADRTGHEAKLEGPRVTAVPLGDGKKRCSGCGAIVNAYAVRCHECKGVFVEQGGQ